MVSLNASIRPWVLSRAAVTISWLFAHVSTSQDHDQLLNLLQYYCLGTQAFLPNIPHHPVRMANGPAPHGHPTYSNLNNIPSTTTKTSIAKPLSPASTLLAVPFFIPADGASGELVALTLLVKAADDVGVTITVLVTLLAPLLEDPVETLVVTIDALVVATDMLVVSLIIAVGTTVAFVVVVAVIGLDANLNGSEK